MLFISDKATLHSSQIAVRSNNYSSTTFTNISQELAVIEHSDDAKIWEVIIQLNPLQSHTINSIKKYIKTTQPIYIQSTTPAFTNPSNPSNPNSPTVDLSGYITKEEFTLFVKNLATQLPASVDTDNDGILDFMEEYLGSDPYKRDSDGDGHNDGHEYTLGYDPKDPSDYPIDFRAQIELMQLPRVSIENGKLKITFDNFAKMDSGFFNTLKLCVYAGSIAAFQKIHQDVSDYFIEEITSMPDYLSIILKTSYEYIPIDHIKE